ncbi:hypothetical protein D3C72_1459570 [compost metagenome]
MRWEAEFFEKQSMQTAVADRHAGGKHPDGPGEERFRPDDRGEPVQALADIGSFIGQAVDQQRRPQTGNIVAPPIRSDDAAHIGDQLPGILRYVEKRRTGEFFEGLRGKGAFIDIDHQ